MQLLIDWRLQPRHSSIDIKGSRAMVVIPCVWWLAVVELVMDDTKHAFMFSTPRLFSYFTRSRMVYKNTLHLFDLI